MHYHAGPAADYRIEPLDSLTLVYHRPAGATHLLAEPAPELLTALMDAPASAEAFLAQFALGPDARDALIERLDELVAAGLVDRQ